MKIFKVKVGKQQKKCSIVYNGAYNEKLKLPNSKKTNTVDKFSYSFNFNLSEPLHLFWDKISSKEEERNTEVIKFLKEVFEEQLKEYLDSKSF